MKTYMSSRGYAYDSLEEALAKSSHSAVTRGEEVLIYKLIKKVAPKTPDVDVTDITV